MKTHLSLRRLVVLVPILFAALVAYQFTLAERPAETVTLKGVGDERFLTFLSTDKPLYKPGETIHMRGVLLHHATRKPWPGDKPNELQAVVEIVGPKGDVVASGGVTAVDSVFGFSWGVPPEQPGGEYTIKLTHPQHGFPPAERKFDVRAYRAPRLKSQVKFLRDGYGPGDEAVATLHTERAEGGIPQGAKLTVTARVDGVEVHRGQATLDDKGNALAKFSLPVDIRRGEGTLAFAIEDGGVVETASKTIPILLQTVDLTLYPEGGNLVAGVVNRVYLEAFTPAHKPADLAGAILDADGKEVAKFHTEHEGRGRFAITPKAGGKYVLRIDEPAGIKTQYPLSEVKELGVALTSVSDVFGAEAQVIVTLASPKEGKYVVSLQQREKILEKQDVQLVAGKPNEIKLAPGDASGVLVVHVVDELGLPLAERLVYRQPKESVRVSIKADQKQYVPGGKAKLMLTTSNTAGKPVSAVVGITVTDDSVLEMIEKREQAPRLPVMVLLENEVRDLADAHVYLDPENPSAPQAVDLLLGTQGWRRFAFVETTKFLAAEGDRGRRAMALRLNLRHDVAAIPQVRLERLGIEGAAPRPAIAPPAGPILPPVDAALPQEAAAAKKEGEVAVPLAANGVVNERSKADQNGPAGKDAKPGADFDEKAKQALNSEIQPAPEPNAAPGVQDGIPAAAKPVPQLAKEGRELAQALDIANKAREGKRLFRDEEESQLKRVRDDFAIVRVYAHEVRANRTPGERRDFTETLYWHAGLKTNEQGEATVEFGLNDSVTSFRAFADAFASSGGLGSTSLQIDSVEPFYLEPKLPLEVTSGDRPRIPVAFVNGTDKALPAGQFTVAAHIASNVRNSQLALAEMAPSTRVRKLLGITVGKFSGDAEFGFSATAGPYSDKVTRHIKVRPLGFPQEIAHGGLISPGDVVSHEFSLPESFVPRSLTTRVRVYPTPLANMTSALERLIQEPCGCFEQTSSTTYPLVMAQQYFKSHQGVDPDIIERAGRTLETGYQRLLGFECKGGGFEWFGADPGHDALTAYGLLEFTDMSDVKHVDANMLERTRKWLLAQRDGKGAYLRKTHTLHTWLADLDLASTYNTWALLEAGVKDDLALEVAFARDAGEKSANTYVTALAANVLVLAGDIDGSNHLLDKLAGKQQPNGSLKDAVTSVVGSGGEALEIETTALAVTAWLKNPSYSDNVEKAIQYLAGVCKDGRYGSTQSSVLALRAIVAYDKARAKPKAPGSLTLLLDGKPVGEAVPFTADTKGAIELPELKELAPGKHMLQLKMEGGSTMPFSSAVKFHATEPNSSEECKLHLETKLRDAKVVEGDLTEATVVVVNRKGEVLPNPIAIIGIPGGLEVRHDQLKELVKEGRISAYEVIGREVVLYWRALEKEQRVDLSLSLVAAIPGVYTAPASRAYLYYTNEHKHWVAGGTAEITPKSE